MSTSPTFRLILCEPTDTPPQVGPFGPPSLVYWSSAGGPGQTIALSDAATVARSGYPECVAMLVQIGDHLSKQYDVQS